MFNIGDFVVAHECQMWARLKVFSFAFIVVDLYV